MKNFKKVVIFSACLITHYSLAKNPENFSVVKTCKKETCTVSSTFEGKRKEIVEFDINKISDVKKINNTLYYFHISCGNPCGYGHYVTKDEVFLTEDNEILFDEKKNCVIYADWNEKKIFSHTFNSRKPYHKLLYNFSEVADYKNNEDYKELLETEPLHQIFKDDAFIDEKGVLHLYAFGKESNLIKLKIKNACESNPIIKS